MTTASFSVQEPKEYSMKIIMDWFRQMIDESDVNNQFDTVKVGKRSPLIHPM